MSTSAAWRCQQEPSRAGTARASADELGAACRALCDETRRGSQARRGCALRCPPRALARGPLAQAAARVASPLWCPRQVRLFSSCLSIDHVQPSPSGAAQTPDMHFAIAFGIFLAKPLELLLRAPLKWGLPGASELSAVPSTGRPCRRDPGMHLSCNELLLAPTQLPWKRRDAEQNGL